MVVLLRGLNTYSGDNVQIGFLKLGNFYAHWEDHLRRREVDSVRVSDLGPGTLKDSYKIALSFLERQIECGSLQNFHLLTHSSGGLIGRKLTTEPHLKSHILSLTTVACPHEGSGLVNVAERWSRRAAARRALSLLGYDLDDRIDHLRELSEEKMTEFNKFHPVMKSLRQVNVPCSLSRSQRAWPFDVMGLLLKNELSNDGDGLLSLNSQNWPDADLFGPLQLDHLSSLGFFMHLSPKNRALAGRELDRLFDHLSPLWHSS